MPTNSIRDTTVMQHILVMQICQRTCIIIYLKREAHDCGLGSGVVCTHVCLSSAHAH